MIIHQNHIRRRAHFNLANLHAKVDRQALAGKKLKRLSVKIRIGFIILKFGLFISKDQKDEHLN